MIWYQISDAILITNFSIYDKKQTFLKLHLRPMKIDKLPIAQESDFEKEKTHYLPKPSEKFRIAVWSIRGYRSVVLWRMENHIVIYLTPIIFLSVRQILLQKMRFRLRAIVMCLSKFHLFLPNNTWHFPLSPIPCLYVISFSLFSWKKRMKYDTEQNESALVYL